MCTFHTTAGTVKLFQLNASQRRCKHSPKLPHVSKRPPGSNAQTGGVWISVVAMRVSSGAFLFPRCVNHFIKGSVRGRVVSEGELSTVGRGEERGIAGGSKGRACSSAQRSGCRTTGSAGCRSQVWVNSLWLAAAPPCASPLTPPSLSHGFHFFKTLPQMIPRELLLGVMQYLFGFCVKTGKSGLVPCAARLSETNAYLFGGVEANFRGSLNVKKFMRTEEMLLFTKLIQESYSKT